MFDSFLKSSNVTLLLPDSLLENEQTLMLKTLKIGVFARIFCLFRIKNVYFYKNSTNKTDQTILKEIFSFLNIPPYLRKKGKKNRYLKFAAILPPIQSPSHLGVEYNNTIFKEGQILDKITTKLKFTELKIDLGQENIVNIKEKTENVTKLNKYKNVIVKINDQETLLHEFTDSIIFWKSNVHFLTTSISHFLQKKIKQDNLIIGASKSGEIIDLNQSFLKSEWKKNQSRKILLLFGPIKGDLKSFIIRKHVSLDIIDKWINLIPNQGTKTVKLEEALICSLSIFNLLN
ncbi:MAG: putative RNA uridine N3 methyltransferase [Promethearchaeota archaeon]